MQFLLVIICCFVLVVLFIQHVLLTSYLRIDEEQAKQTMEEVLYSIQDELKIINTSMLNYSAWDDTYEFIQASKVSDSYIESNYTPSMFETNRLNLVLLLDGQYHITYGQSYDLQKKAVQPLPSYFQDSANLANLTQFEHNDDTKMGLLQIDGQPMMIISQPILTSDFQGPIRGTMIAGRTIGVEEVQNLRLRTQKNLQVMQVSQVHPPVPAVKIWVENQTRSTSRVYGIVHDIAGMPCFVVAVEQERVVYREGLKTIFSLGMYIILIAALAVFAALKASDRVVINRINTLNESIRFISRSQNVSVRIQPSGQDEIGELESEFNRMMTSLEHAQNTIRDQAMLDPLTRLPNRVAFYEKLEAAIDRARRSQKMLAVLFVDLDHFKYINDTWGHDAGDHLLLSLVERIKASLCHNSLISRLGGDEFTILLTDLEEPELVHDLAARICDTLSEPLRIADRELKVTASIGYSIYPHDGTAAESLIKNADLAMYTGKTQGRNGINAYNDEMRQEVKKQESLEMYLRTAVEQDELFLQYQPIVDLSTGETVCVEALVRWHHPILGRVSPLDFIPLAEKTGLIHGIGKWVLQTGCAQIKALHSFGRSDLHLAVNASAVQLEQPGFVNEVMDVLHETGFDPCSLKIEITESALMSDVDGVIEKLQHLRDAGIEISIDDFGTGYSSLHYLKKFPLDTLKVDKSFIDEILAEDSDSTIAKAIIDLGRNLGLTVVAEGVETAEQVQFLRDQDCYFVQGYYFSKPLDFQVLTTYLTAAATV